MTKIIPQIPPIESKIGFCLKCCTYRTNINKYGICKFCMRSMYLSELNFTKAKKILIGMQDGWMEYDDEYYNAAAEYVIKHVDRLYEVENNDTKRLD